MSEDTRDVQSKSDRPVAPAAGADYEDYSPTLVERLRGLSPALVILTLGSLGCFLFMILAVTSHTTPVAVLMSAGVVTGLIFGVDAVISTVATWRATQDGETGRAFLLAVVGGVACMLSFGAFAGVAVLLLVLNS
jgi:hypothetical protein